MGGLFFYPVVKWLIVLLIINVSACLNCRYMGADNKATYTLRDFQSINSRVTYQFSHDRSQWMLFSRNYILEQFFSQFNSDSYQFFHRGPTFSRNRPVLCGSVDDIVGCQGAGGITFGFCWRSGSLGYFLQGVSCSPVNNERIIM